MDRRQYPRFTADEKVSVALLEEDARVLVGKLLDFSQRGLRVEVPEGIRVGALAKIELEDALLFGEVIHLQSLEVGFVAGIEIEEMIGKAMLRKLRSDAEDTPDVGVLQNSEDLEDCEVMLPCL